MNPHSPYFQEVVGELEPMLRTYYPLNTLSFRALCDYFAWYWNRGTMAYVIDNYGAHGVCLIKLFRRLEQFLDAHPHDPCGQFAMIDLMVADTPNVMAQLFDELVSKWGRQEVVLWDRGERTEDGAPRIYRWDQFQKLARRVTLGILEEA